MASPRSTWTGAIVVGAVSIPVTIGKATEDERESDLRTLCGCHELPIERNERCKVTGKPPAGKTKGAAVPDAEGNLAWHALSDREVSEIESKIKSDRLEILETQPLDSLPMLYSYGQYYLRPNLKVKGVGVQSFRLLLDVLHENRMGIVTKWAKNSAKQKLGVIHAAESGQVLMMSLIPYESERRQPGELELAASDVVGDRKAAALMRRLVFSYRRRGQFHWGAYSDEALRIRTEAVERIVAKHGDKRSRAAPMDVMAALEMSIAEARRTRKTRARSA